MRSTSNITPKISPQIVTNHLENLHDETLCPTYPIIVTDEDPQSINTARFLQLQLKYAGISESAITNLGVIHPNLTNNYAINAISQIKINLGDLYEESPNTHTPLVISMYHIENLIWILQEMEQQELPVTHVVALLYYYPKEQIQLLQQYINKITFIHYDRENLDLFELIFINTISKQQSDFIYKLGESSPIKPAPLVRLSNTRSYNPALRSIVVKDNGGNTTTIRLTDIEAKVLNYMLKRPNQIISKPDFVRETWNYKNGRATDSNIVEVAIRRLRLKIEEDPSKPDIILTIRGKKYGQNSGYYMRNKNEA